MSAHGRRLALSGIALAAAAWPLAAQGRVLRVGVGEALTTVSQAAKVAVDGDVVEVTAGDYVGDVAVWLQKRLSIRGVGGPVRLHAGGHAAERKAIWVIRDGDFDISGIDFLGAKVPDRNGAGIRFEGGNLTVRNCRFWDSECGILTSGGARLRSTRLQIEACEFGYLGDGEGQAHGLYAGDIGLLRVVGSYFHHGRVGHLIKSRAAVNDIRFNRITDEIDGAASYEVDLPNGGLAVLVGNLVQQGPRAENWSLLTFGQEGYRPPPNRLYVASNTFVNDRSLGGVFVRAVSGFDSATLINNVWCGRASLQLAGQVQQLNNVQLESSRLHRSAQYDFRLRDEGWQFVRPLVEEIEGMKLVPDAEYLHPRQRRPLAAFPDRPGALQSRST